MVLLNVFLNAGLPHERWQCACGWIGVFCWPDYYAELQKREAKVLYHQGTCDYVRPIRAALKRAVSPDDVRKAMGEG